MNIFMVHVTDITLFVFVDNIIFRKRLIYEVMYEYI